MMLTTSRLVALVESAEVNHALRYEPNFAKYVLRSSMVKCVEAHSPAYMNLTTAKHLLMFSYGRFQIMGENIYALGYGKPLAEFLTNETDQNIMFYEFLKSRDIFYTFDELRDSWEKRKKFAIKYNGSAAYANTLLQAIQYMEGN
jgi:hypothetical protein